MNEILAGLKNVDLRVIATVGRLPLIWSQSPRETADNVAIADARLYAAGVPKATISIA